MTTSKHQGSEGRHRRRAGTTRQPVHPPPAWTPLGAPGLGGGDFVGRETEVAEFLSLLDTHRVVTLVGPPGVGKTCLARQVAVRLPEPDTLYVVELDQAPPTDS